MKIIENSYFGLSACCVMKDTYEHVDRKGIETGRTTITLLPRFFLFCDIDTKDQEVLRLCIQHYARNGLSFYCYETRKGYHLVSPDLLTLGEWRALSNGLKPFLDNYYVFDVIRITNKSGDGNFKFYYDFYDRKHHLSKQLIDLMYKRFGTHTLPEILLTETELETVRYTHHEFMEKDIEL